jgi:ADP-heptose:LPS heptosyltransferase
MRLLLILPCCIGDCVMATATLQALRRGYPDAHITWAVGGWARRAVEYHPALNAILDTGTAALPVKSIGGFPRFVGQVRAGSFDMAVSLVRSPLMSLAMLLTGIPQRVGLDSNGRGFGYTIKAKIDPQQARPEGDIYLDTARALGLDVTGCYVNLPVQDAARQTVAALRQARSIPARYLVLHPGGGSNPGMMMDSKRYPPEQWAVILNAIAPEFNLHPVLLGASSDAPLIQAVSSHLDMAHTSLVGELDFPQIGALAADAVLYLGNDTGMTHLAAASGAKTVMMLGPSDPARYAPFVPSSQALALWQPTAHIAAQGVAQSMAQAWDWARDGITPTAAIAKIRGFMQG